MSEKLTLVKIGGQVVDDESSLHHFLDEFAKLDGLKVLVHGGGKLATELADKLAIPQTLVEGRRITDAETLKVTAMVYAGLVNKTLVALLQARQVPAFGLSGADGNAMLAVKRKLKSVDYGYVGDIASVNIQIFRALFAANLVPVLAPITHDGRGQLLNTNADTIAQTLATKLSGFYEIDLYYLFEKSGVLSDLTQENSAIPKLVKTDFERLKSEGKIFAGMIPKLENAFQAIDSGVQKVVLGKARDLRGLIEGTSGTTLRKNA